MDISNAGLSALIGQAQRPQSDPPHSIRQRIANYLENPDVSDREKTTLKDGIQKIVDQGGGPPQIHRFFVNFLKQKGANDNGDGGQTQGQHIRQRIAGYLKDHPLSERESHYMHDQVKKILDQGGDHASVYRFVVNFLKHQNDGGGNGNASPGLDTLA